MSLVFALLSALGFGAGDFLAGLASRKTPAPVVSFYSQLTALVVVAGVALPFGGSPTLSGLTWGAAAGFAIGCGLVRYYHGLSTGPMGLVATVMAVFSALVPFTAGLVIGERPASTAIAGVAAAVVALILITSRNRPPPRLPPSASAMPSRSPSAISLRSLVDGVVSGTCFGFSFVFLGFATTENPLWPVFMTLAGSLVPLLILQYSFFRILRKGDKFWRIVLAAGVCQGLGLLAFGLAVIDGLISIVSVAAALSPIPTALLALIVLGQRLSRRQILGLIVALAGVALLTLG